MNKKSLFFFSAIMVLVGFGAFFAQAATQEAPKTTDTPASPKETKGNEAELPDIQKLSEAFGHFIGRNLNNPGMSFDLESLIKGMRDGAAGKPSPMSDQEYEAMMMKLQEKAFSQVSEDNLKAANAFLEKNGHEKNIVVVEPGKLQYKILEEGKGAVVENHASPQIEYVGKYLDGTVFGSSKETGGPITIPLDQTIPGFSKGIVGMKEGEKRRLFIHPDLGYGTSGHLPPNSLLIFDIEVIKAQAPITGAQEGLADDEEGDDYLLPLALEMEEEEEEDEEDEEKAEKAKELPTPPPGDPSKPQGR